MFIVSRVLKKLAWDHSRFVGLYLRVCNPRNNEYAKYLKHVGYFFSMGDDCLINRDVTVTDPKYVRLGNNVCLSSCSLIGHDGAIAVLNRAYNVRLDSVGKIDIKDNVFVGLGAIILPGVTIGENSIIAAGAVVSKDVEAGSIVGGVPAKVIGKTDSLVKRLQDQTNSYPWADLIRNREGAYDPGIEATLVQLRQKHFYES